MEKTQRRRILTRQEWRLTERAFWKIAGEMKASGEFTQTSLFKTCAQDSHLIKRQVTFMLESGMINEVSSPRGIYYILNKASPFWTLFKNMTPDLARNFYKKVVPNEGKRGVTRNLESD